MLIILSRRCQGNLTKTGRISDENRTNSASLKLLIKLKAKLLTAIR